MDSNVMLNNSNGFLPLDKAKLKSAAVIGPEADKFETGNYFGAKPRIVSPVDGIRAKLGSGVQVEYAPGCDILEPAKAGEIGHAAELARKSDVAILFRSEE